MVILYHGTGQNDDVPVPGLCSFLPGEEEKGSLMNQTVPALSIAFMALAWAVSFFLPIGLLVYFRKKGADISPFFIGWAVMLLFAFILESLVHQAVLSSPVGERIRGSVWLFALYGGFMAGIFEETGRYLAFSTVLKKKLDNKSNALMYGAGHGGFEAMAILGITSVNNMIWSFMINSGQAEALTQGLTGEVLDQARASIEALTTTPSYQFLMGGLERIFAICLHIALSILVWTAVREKKRRILYPLAVLIHMLVDAVTALLAGLGVSVLVIEALVGLMCLLSLLYAIKIYREEPA